MSSGEVCFIFSSSCCMELFVVVFFRFLGSLQFFSEMFCIQVHFFLITPCTHSLFTILVEGSVWQGFKSFFVSIGKFSYTVNKFIPLFNCLPRFLNFILSCGVLVYCYLRFFFLSVGVFSCGACCISHTYSSTSLSSCCLIFSGREMFLIFSTRLSR